MDRRLAILDREGPKAVGYLEILAELDIVIGAGLLVVETDDRLFYRA